MAYSIVKCGNSGTTGAPIEVFSVFERHGAVVTVRVIPNSSGASGFFSVYVRTVGGQDDIPVALRMPFSPGKPFELKGIYVHARQTLVITSTADVDWIVDGYGQIAATAEDLPQGRMFSQFGWKQPGNEYLSIEIPDIRNRVNNLVEMDLFINGLVTEPTRVDVKISDTPLISSTAFNDPIKAFWLLTTVISPGTPTQEFRKMLFGYRYIGFKFYGEDISVYAQYNMRDHTLI